MQRLEISRRGDLSIADHLAEMRAWLAEEGIRATGLRAVHIMAGRVTFRATFESEIDGNRFQEAFAEL
jgi:hypothetical protein